MDGNIFEKILGQESLFMNRKIFDHGFEPSRLPHRENEINSLKNQLIYHPLYKMMEQKELGQLLSTVKHQFLFLMILKVPQKKIIQA